MHLKNVIETLTKIISEQMLKPQPHRTVLEYFAIFKNVAHSNSVSHKATNNVQRS